MLDLASGSSGEQAFVQLMLVQIMDEVVQSQFDETQTYFSLVSKMVESIAQNSQAQAAIDVRVIIQKLFDILQNRPCLELEYQQREDQIANGIIAVLIKFFEFFSELREECGQDRHFINGILQMLYEVPEKKHPNQPPTGPKFKHKSTKMSLLALLAVLTKNSPVNLR